MCQHHTLNNWVVTLSLQLCLQDTKYIHHCSYQRSMCPWGKESTLHRRLVDWTHTTLEDMLHRLRIHPSNWTGQHKDRSYKTQHRNNRFGHQCCHQCYSQDQIRQPICHHTACDWKKSHLSKCRWNCWLAEGKREKMWITTNAIKSSGNALLTVGKLPFREVDVEVLCVSKGTTQYGHFANSPRWDVAVESMGMVKYIIGIRDLGDVPIRHVCVKLFGMSKCAPQGSHLGHSPFR